MDWPRTINPVFAPNANATGFSAPLHLAQDAWNYCTDACQRALLFCDVLQRRTKRYHEHGAQLTPHVLKFVFELIMDGRKLPRPVNYAWSVSGAAWR